MSDRSASLSHDENREFELTLGNKQALSVLFIIFVLLGVFFAMGYVMGRSSAPTDMSGAPAGDPPVRTPAPSAAPEKPAAIDSAQAASSESPEKPADTAGNPAESKDERPAGKPIIIGNPEITDPQPGQTYLQVSAVAKPEAELLTELLTKKGFRAIMAPGPNDKLFRVLVGPADDQPALSKLRSELEQSGFKPMVRKY